MTALIEKDRQPGRRHPATAPRGRGQAQAGRPKHYVFAYRPPTKAVQPQTEFREGAGQSRRRSSTRSKRSSASSAKADPRPTNAGCGVRLRAAVCADRSYLPRFLNSSHRPCQIRFGSLPRRSHRNSRPQLHGASAVPEKLTQADAVRALGRSIGRSTSPAAPAIEEHSRCARGRRTPPKVRASLDPGGSPRGPISCQQVLECVAVRVRAARPVRRVVDVRGVGWESWKSGTAGPCPQAIQTPQVNMAYIIKTPPSLPSKRGLWKSCQSFESRFAAECGRRRPNLCDAAHGGVRRGPVDGFSKRRRRQAVQLIASKRPSGTLVSIGRWLG